MAPAVPTVKPPPLVAPQHGHYGPGGAKALRLGRPLTTPPSTPDDSIVSRLERENDKLRRDLANRPGKRPRPNDRQVQPGRGGPRSPTPDHNRPRNGPSAAGIPDRASRIAQGGHCLANAVYLCLPGQGHQDCKAYGGLSGGTCPWVHATSIAGINGAKFKANTLTLVTPRFTGDIRAACYTALNV